MRRNILRNFGFLIGFSLLLLIHGLAHAQDSDEFFERKIRPILAGTCFKCHGGQKEGGSLRTDTRQALISGGDNGAAIVPEKPDESILIQAVKRQEGIPAMPPDKALTPEEVESLVEWVRRGAPWPAETARFESEKHWAFEPVHSPPLPETRDSAWPRTSIDRFILGRLEREHLQPAPPADRRTLLRRVTYDLTGLPPSPEQVDQFTTDPRPTPIVLEETVERLLASPQYGEHWGRHWLDVVRYADTAGENSDHPLPHAWRYRNWVINAFNANQPFDEFIRHQIAGDLLVKDVAPHIAEQRTIATGYLAIARRFGHDIDEDMHLTFEDTIDNLGKAVLGLTLGCARCHDHKYDPLTAKDYYGLYGIFESTKFSFPGCEPKQQPRDLVLLDPAESNRLQSEIAGIEAEVAKLKTEEEPTLRDLNTAVSKGSELLSRGEIPEGGTSDFAAGEKLPLTQRQVRRGDVLLLSISPLGNYGADTTLVELEITQQGKTGPPGTAPRWSLGDLVAGLTHSNPHPDSRGNSSVWCFVSAKDSLKLLGEDLQETFGAKEIQSWRTNSSFPAVFVNSSDSTVKVATSLSPKSFFVHPSETESAGIAWISPLDGIISISGKIADAHQGGPDGVGWKLEHFTTPEVAQGLIALGRHRELAADLIEKITTLKEQHQRLPVAYAVSEGTPHNTRIQKRGEPKDLGDEVPRKFIDILGGQKLEAPAFSGRLELAQWLTSPSNPLTARVFVNRIWQWHFGRGIVATPNDFGTRGAKPTHPELLDHLASEFINSGWNLKELHRRIVLSSTYQQATGSSQSGHLYNSFPRRRLTAEELRDTLLLVSGELNLAPAEKHPFPEEKTWSFTQHKPFADEYEINQRSIYVMQKRNRRSRFFALFDGADPNATTPLRDVTTVPTQALFFLNDPFLHARAAKFAEIICNSANNDSDRLGTACRILFGRPPEAEEIQESATFLREYSSTLPSDPSRDPNRTAWEAFARVLMGSNEVLYVD